MVVGLHEEKKIVKETREMTDDRFAHPLMLTEEMYAGVRKNERIDCEQKKRECIQHMVFSLTLVISLHPFIFYFSIYAL